LQQRLLVGFYGERAQFGWWPTAFYEASIWVSPWVSERWRSTVDWSSAQMLNPKSNPMWRISLKICCVLESASWNLG